MESAFHLHQATGVDPLRAAGRAMVEGLQRHARVPEGGFANIRNVQGHVQEDHMSSYFLAETLAYLYLLFDDTFVKRNPYVPSVLCTLFFLVAHSNPTGMCFPPRATHSQSQSACRPPWLLTGR